MKPRPAFGLTLLLVAVPALAQPRRPEAKPLDKEQLLARANAEAAAGRSAEAMRLLRTAADRFRSVRALLQLARLQSERKDAAAALESLRRALTLAPNAEEVLSAYAQLSLGTRTPLPAILALEPLTRTCPSVAQYHYLLGVALMQAGDMPAAVESLERAERLEPDRPLTLIALAIALNGRKLYGESRPRLVRSLELAPENVEAVAALAEAEEGLGELEPAEAHARRVLAKAPGHATANLVLGLVRMKQERYAEAREAFETAVAAEPDAPKAHYQLSLACARLGDDATAKAHVERYRQALQEAEERLRQIRTQTGLSAGGARR